MSNVITVIHNSDQYITVIRYYIPFIVIIIRIGVSCLVSKDSMTSGDIHVLKGSMKLTGLK